MMMYLLTYLLLGGPDLIRPGQAVRQIETLMAEPAFGEGFWGVAVYAPMRGKFLLLHHSRRALRPASNMKILTTLMAFDELGVDYRFNTAFNRTGPVADGVLDGDLVVRGRGDPSISGHYTFGAVSTASLLAEVTTSIRAAGIRHINGDLVAVTGFFDSRSLSESWEWFDVGTSYGTPVRALALNDGRLEIDLNTDAVGALSVVVSPETVPGFQLTSRLTHLWAPARMDIRQEWGTNRFILEGNLPPCSNRQVVRSVWDPTEQFLVTFRQALERDGIELAGQLRQVATLDDPNEEFVHSRVSANLSDLAPVLMKYSQNHYADLFLRTIAAELAGEGSFEAGAALADRFLRRISGDGSMSLGLSMRDGSGLSPQNYMTPAQIAALLRYGLRQTYRRAWLATFPVMGLDGTLKQRGGDLTRGRVWAKTGYIYRSRCLSGYLETLSGEPLIFSMMVNNYACSTAEVNRAQDRICGILVRLKPTRKVRRGEQLHQLSNLATPLAQWP